MEAINVFQQVICYFYSGKINTPSPALLLSWEKQKLEKQSLVHLGKPIIEKGTETKWFDC